MDEIEVLLKDIPEIATYSKLAGYSMMAGVGTSGGNFTLKLRDWSERDGAKHGSDAVIGRIMGMVGDVRNANVFAFAPPMIMGYGNSNGFSVHLQDRAGGDISALEDVCGQFVGALNARPEIAMAYTSFSSRYPQYRVDVDAAKCKRAGVSPSEVLGVIGGYYGGVYASQFNRFTKVYYVVTEAAPEYRMDKPSLDNVFVRTAGGMSPSERVRDADQDLRYRISVAIQPL